jgi:pimeloyl-ACP methyl ester carboxylesterase
MTLQTPTEIEIPTRLYRIAAKQWGTVGGLPTIGLHGWMDNANTFDHLAPLLPRLNLIAIDLPGHGLSEHRPDKVRYHYYDFVDDVLAVADALQWERFVLMGHSMGGGVASLFTAACGERVSHLVLIEGFGVVTRDPQEAPDALRRAILAMQRPPRSQRPRYKTFEELVAARTKAGTIKPDSARTLVRRAVTQDDQGLRWLSDQRLRWPWLPYYSNEIMLALLQRIEAPALLITGDSGTLKKWPYFKSRLQAVKNLRWVDLPGHHHLHLDNPEPVARAIDDFLPAVIS